MREFADSVLNSYNESADMKQLLWNMISEEYTSLTDRLVPSKMPSQRFSQVCISKGLKQLSRYKKRAFYRARETFKEKD